MFLGVPALRITYRGLFGVSLVMETTISCNRTKRRRTTNLTRRVRMRRPRKPEQETSKTRAKRTSELFLIGGFFEFWGGMREEWGSQELGLPRCVY